MNRNVRGKQKKGVCCEAKDREYLRIDWIRVSNVLEISKRRKTEKCPFVISNMDVIGEFSMSHIVEWRCGIQFKMNLRMFRG